MAISGAGSLASAQTPVSSSFNLGVIADANQGEAGSAQDAYASSQGATLDPYAASVSATNTATNGAFVTTHSSATATWASAGQGRIELRDFGWTVSAGATNFMAVLENPTNRVWRYTFGATAPGTFRLDYDVRGYGNTFGLGGISIAWSGPEGGISAYDASDPTASGSMVRNLAAGEEYTVWLYAGGGLYGDSGPTIQGRYDADLDWKVTNAVPEPSSLAVVGLGALGALRRLRRR